MGIGEPDNENRGREQLFVFGEELTFSEMLAESGRPSTDEAALLDPSEFHRFGGYARLVWDGLLELERVRLQ